MAERKPKRQSATKQKFPKKMRVKLVLLFGAIVLAFVALIIRVIYINAADGERYTKIVLDQQQYNSRLIAFKRGNILDRNGTVVATSERVYNVVLDVYVLRATDDKEEPEAIRQVKEALETCFAIEPEVVDETIETKPEGRYCVLKKEVSYADAQKFEEMKKETYEDEKGKKHKLLTFLPVSGWRKHILESTRIIHLHQMLLVLP